MQHMLWHIHNPRGSVLIVGLFTLALLALLGAAATSTSRTDVSIAGNMRVLQESFYASEVALTEGELWVDGMKTEFDLDATNIGYYDEGKQDLSTMNWNRSDSIEVQASVLPQSMDNTAAPPRFTIEKRDYIPDSLKLGKPPTGIHQYNITSQGTGSNRRTTTILRTVFAERFN
jgi:type IV pilus assembly protein PilX